MHTVSENAAKLVNEDLICELQIHGGRGMYIVKENFARNLL